MSTKLASERPAERVLVAICGQCGEGFSPTRPHQKFCRPSCRMAYFKAKAERQAVDTDADLFRVPFE